MARVAGGTSYGRVRAFRTVGAALVAIGSVNFVIGLVRLAEEHRSPGFLGLAASALMVVLGSRVRSFDTVERFGDRSFGLLAAALAVSFFAQLAVH